MAIIKNLKAVPTETDIDSPGDIFDGGERFMKADWRVHCLLAETDESSNNAEDVINLCLQTAEKHNLSDDELAFLVIWQLIAWRGSNVSSGWAIKIADAILQRVPKEDRMSCFCKKIADLLFYVHETSNEVDRRLSQLMKAALK